MSLFEDDLKIDFTGKKRKTRQSRNVAQENLKSEASYYARKNTPEYKKEYEDLAKERARKKSTQPIWETNRTINAKQTRKQYEEYRKNKDKYEKAFRKGK